MTKFQDLAEQGAEAGAFNSEPTPYPTYQYSVFLNGSRDELLVVRAATFADLLASKRQVQQLLQREEQGQRAPESETQRHGRQTVPPHTPCAHILTRTQVVKKAGPNKGRLFTICQTCDQFLGFV